MVSRPRLVERLRSSADAPLLLVTAPAGYGKTILAAEWAEQDRRPSAWLTLSRVHDDPAYLLACVVAALDRIEPVDPAVTEALSGLIPDIEGTALPRLQAGLQADRADFTLVLDDVHSLAEDACFEVLGGIIECLLPGSSLVLVARAEPHLSLGRFRAGRRLGEITRADLAMTRSESLDLLTGLGLDLDPERARTLFERTEGWPAALYLAGLSLSEQDDTDQAIAEFAGDDRFVGDYLRDEFIADRTEAELSFLTRSSVLDRMSGPLCDAVLGESASGETLRALSRSNTLISRLDHRDEWFRYHALLREMLAAELRNRDSSAEAPLHRRAAAWYAEREDFDHAISHAIAAGDEEMAGELIWQAHIFYAGHGRIATIERWLERFDEATIAANPALSLTAAYASMTRCDGNATERWIGAMRRTADGGPGAFPPSHEPARKLAEALMNRHGAERMCRDALASYELSPEDDPWRSVACFSQGMALFLLGDSGAARSRLEEAVRRSATVPHILALSHAQLALVLMDDNRSAAAESIDHARAQLQRHGLCDYATMALVLATFSLFDARSGQTGRAVDEVDEALVLLKKTENFAPWFETETRVVLTSTLLRLGDISRAREILADAAREFEHIPDATVLGEWIEAARRSIRDASRESGLTPAELRVLQFMPTHLSFREIATHLYVSPNTVKTQAQAIYRKLDASARAEAVDAARRTGLLESGQSAPND